MTSVNGNRLRPRESPDPGVVDSSVNQEPQSIDQDRDDKVEPGPSPVNCQTSTYQELISKQSLSGWAWLSKSRFLLVLDMVNSYNPEQASHYIQRETQYHCNGIRPKSLMVNV